MRFAGESKLEYFMSKCIDLAKNGWGVVSKPVVGAIVLDSQERVIGEGWKRLIEGTSLVIHAERDALDRAGDEARGGTLITTLEPCFRKKREKLVFECCARLTVNRGITTVVCGMVDKSDFSYCGGINYLRDQGVKVIHYRKLNPVIMRLLMPHSRQIERFAVNP